MSNNEVQTNSVIYSRKDYVMTLYNAQRAFSLLKTLRDEQIAEWKSDTEAREADLNRVIMYRYTRHESHRYDRYLEALKAPAKPTWWQKLFKLHLVDKTDVYGSLEAYVASTTGKTFEEYKASEIARISEYTQGDSMETLRWLSSNGHRFMDNEWQEKLDAVSKMLTKVEYDNFDAQFIIPREEFDGYASAMVLADGGKLEEVGGTLHQCYTWY